MFFFFDEDGKIYLYMSRNAYCNWNWDASLGKYIEESNIIVVELERAWWDDPTASTMPEIVASQRDKHAKDAPKLPCNIGSYNGTGDIGRPPRKDGWTTVISYGADPQAWENFHVDDYTKFNGTKKNRRWSEGSTLLRRRDAEGRPGEVLPEEESVTDEDGGLVYGFGESDVTGLAYQRENVNGSWSTMMESRL